MVTIDLARIIQSSRHTAIPLKSSCFYRTISLSWYHRHQVSGACDSLGTAQPPTSAINLRLCNKPEPLQSNQANGFGFLRLRHGQGPEVGHQRAFGLGCGGIGSTITRFGHLLLRRPRTCDSDEGGSGGIIGSPCLSNIRGIPNRVRHGLNHGSRNAVCAARCFLSKDCLFKWM